MNERDQYVGSDGHLTEEAIALYVDALKLGQMDKLPAALVAHADTCRQCRSDVADLYSIIAGEDYTTTGPHPFFDRAPSSRRRIGRAALYRIAATVVVGVGFALAYLLLHRPSNSPAAAPGQIARIDTVAPDTEKKQLNSQDDRGRGLHAANFTESANLEDLVGGHVRSGNVQVLSPKNGETVRDSVRFRWQGRGAGDGTFVVQVLTNRERVVATQTVSGTQVTLRRRFDPGLYYWKLESRRRLLYVGKFLVQ